MLAGAVPSLLPRRAHAQENLGDTLNFTTWPNYFAQENLDNFTAETGVAINVSVFGSNEEMLAKLQAGGTGWDVFVPTNYTISTYKELDLIEPLDLTRLPNFDPSTHDERFIGVANIDGEQYAVPKDWGTTGYVVNTAEVEGEMTTWKEFWDRTRDDLTGRVMVHDYQLTTIGNALKYFGYSFNSIDPAELAKAEELLIEAKPHLFAINSDYQPSMRSGDAWVSVCWTGDAAQLKRDMPEMQYVLGKEGGEIWTDFYAIPKGAPHRDAAYAFINFMLDPEVNAKEVEAHGYPSTDSKTNELVLGGDAGESDPLSGGGTSVGAGVRRGEDAHRSAARRDHGTIQVGMRSQRRARRRFLPRMRREGDHAKHGGGGGTTGDASLSRPPPPSAATLPRDGGGSAAASPLAMTATTRSRLVSATMVAPAAFFFAALLILPLIVVVVYSLRRARAGRRLPGRLHARQLREPAGARHGVPQHADARTARHADLRRWSPIRSPISWPSRRARAGARCSSCWSSCRSGPASSCASMRG